MKAAIKTAVSVLIVFSLVFLSGCGEASRYSQAVTALENGDYEASAEYFYALGDYKDSRERGEEARRLAEKQADYKKAVALTEGGDYARAAEIFTALGTYSDSPERAEECRHNASEENYTAAADFFNAGDYIKARDLFSADPEYRDTALYLKAIGFLTCQAGDSVLFGSYAQEEDGTAAPISWTVISREEGRVLLLSEQGLEYMRFHKKLYPFWADSEMREWLNTSFLSTAFTEQERKLIALSDNTTPGYSSDLGLYMGGPDTEDLIFLMSKEELREYLPEDISRICKATPYAESAAELSDEDDTCAWWTRSPGNHHGKISAVTPDGELNANYRVYRKDVAVRPAIWIDLSKLVQG